MNSDINVYSIIVTYNGELWIKSCLQSLRSSTILNKIIVVDNDSTDKTKEIITKDFPEVILIEAPLNLGFGRANNLALSYAFNQACDYVFLLNQDSWIEKDSIQKLIEVHKENSRYGILSPMHLRPNGSVFESLYSYIREWDCPGFLSDLYHRKELKNVYQIKFINAAFWLISRECLATVGGFDPIFELYREDIDYAERVYFHNLKIGIVPKSIGYHDHTPLHKSPLKNEKRVNKTYAAFEIKSINTFPPSRKILFLYLIRQIIKDLIDLNFQSTAIIYYKIRIYKKAEQHKLISQKKGPSFLGLH